MDQKDIWTSPFHMNRHDAIPWIVFGAATGALIAGDRHIARQLPNTVDQVAISKDVSNVGAVYTVLPITAGLYIGGAISHNPKARETGILGGEAALDSLIVVAVLKSVTQRSRPLESNGNGSFFTGGGSFPSGHSAEAWALVSVVAHAFTNNPDARLRAHARREGWRVYDYRTGRKAARAGLVTGTVAGGVAGAVAAALAARARSANRP